MPEAAATWGGLEIQIVSEPVVTALEAVKGFLDLVNTALDIALQVGNVVKTFVTSNLDLVRALANELIASLRNLIKDLFGLGIYANLGDLDIVRRGKEGLRGGYPAWERRMLTRLNNRNDPNRPDYTSSSTVLAMFFYLGVDVSFVNGLLDTTKFQPITQFLRAFASLFGFNVGGGNTALPVATNLHAEYASPDNTGAPDFSIALSSLLGRTKVKVIWNCAPAPGGSTQDPAPQIPPSGFLVEVSCYRSGFQTAWIAPAPSGTGTSDASNQAFITGQYQQGATGNPLVIFGGEDAILLNPDVQFPPGYTPGTSTLAPGSHPVYFFRDAQTPEVIRRPFGKGAAQTDNGRDITPYYNQRRFFVPKASVLQQAVSGGNYSIELDLERLPLFCPIKADGTIDASRAIRPQAVYVRVVPVSERITADNFTRARWKPLAHTNDDTTQVHLDPITLALDPELDDADLGIPSEVIEVLVPGANQDLYGKAVQTAIALVVLTRADLTAPNPVTENAPTTPDRTYRARGLESIAVEVFRNMGINNPDEYFSRRNVSPQSFLTDLYPRIVAKADEYIRTQGGLPPAVLAALEDTMHDLVNWQWANTEVADATGNRALRVTILDSLNPANYATSPLAQNRYDTRDFFTGQPATPDVVLVQTERRWRAGTFGILNHKLSLDSAPIIGPSTNAEPNFWFARDLVPDLIYAKARTVLAITSDQTTLQRTPAGSWQSKRVFAPRAPMGTALTVLTKVEGFLNTSLSGLQNVADGILRVISFLEQRVREVQELIKRIETYLDIPFNVSFPSVKALVLITNGTDGIISGLLSSQQKPQEGPNGYAGGGVFVAGSAPSILTELLSKGISAASSAGT